jgi:hypothetical protein
VLVLFEVQLNGHNFPSYLKQIVVTFFLQMSIKYTLLFHYTVLSRPNGPLVTFCEVRNLLGSIWGKRMHQGLDKIRWEKSTIFWDITLCSPLRVNRCFVGTYCLYLQGWNMTEDDGDMFLRNVGQLSTDHTAFYIPEDGTLQNYRC